MPNILWASQRQKLLLALIALLLLLAQGPARSLGWKEAIIRYFMEKLQELNKGPWQCRMDGCRYGLRNDQGEFLNKAWTILTTDLHFYNEFRLKVCLKNHQHAWVHGMDTARSAYYPRAMCTSIARNWQKVLIPQRWLTMLWTASIEQEN